MPTKKTNTYMILISLIVIMAGSFYFVNITGNFSLFEKSDETQTLEECIEACKEMQSKLFRIVPESEEYAQQLEKINKNKEQCLSLNELEEEPLSEEEILESCGYMKRTLGTQENDCVPSGETIYIEENESCEEGIQRCCSGRGLCGKDQLSIPDHVVCLSY